jgi:CBS domain-containing protein
MAATTWSEIPDLDAWRRAGGVSASVSVVGVMSWPAIALEPHMASELASRWATDQQIHHFPVLLRGELVGVVCTCDLDRAGASEDVASCMSHGVITIEPDATLSDAAQLMDDHEVNCLLCSWRGGWGILTRGDLVRAGACQARECFACGSRHHVRRQPRYEEQWFCSDCTEPRSDPELKGFYDDFGGGD